MWWRKGIELLLLLAIISVLQWRVKGQATSCESSTTCNSFSMCVNGTCTCQSDSISLSGTNTDCFSLAEPNPSCSGYDSSCVFCGSLFQGPCLRCITSLTLSRGTCVAVCPSGSFQITAVPGITGFTSKTCTDSGTDDSLPQWAIIVIALVAVVIFVVIVVGVLGLALSILTRSSHGQFDIMDGSAQETGPDLRQGGSPSGTLRTKRSNSFSFENKQPMIRHNPNFSEQIEGDDETVFFHKLDYLRTQAEVFLKMLNDMRRRLKEIPVDSSAAQQYRNVMQDVTRLLYLLNKKRSSVQMPADGLQLMIWSEQILERFLVSQGVTLQREETTTTNRLSVLGPQDETNF